MRAAGRARFQGPTVALMAFALAAGLAAGLGGYTFVYAKGASYLTNDPAACANCHVMNEHYSGWVRSSHRAVATCNDCHTPKGIVGKYATKASNGSGTRSRSPPAATPIRSRSKGTTAKSRWRPAASATPTSCPPWTAATAGRMR